MLTRMGSGLLNIVGYILDRTILSGMDHPCFPWL